MFLKFAFLFLSCVGSSALFAHEPTTRLPEILVEDESETESRIERGAILPTERLTRKRIQAKRAQTLTEAVAKETGIDSQTSCANCGSKRVTINGMRGEHTTILVDGVPLHSAVSSFYGVDAVPMAGVEEIEITRGAGASLTAPEAIGGVLNIITQSPTESFFKSDVQVGTANTLLFSGAAAQRMLDGKFRLFAAGQWGRQGLWDVDGNGVSDAPDFKNAGILVKGMLETSSRSNLEFRYAFQRVGILGGTTDGTRPTSALAVVVHPTFINNDVSQKFTDTQDKIADVIDLHRHEAMGRLKYRLGDATQLVLTTSGAWQAQDSIYFHGYDYANKDFLFFQEAKMTFPLGEDHIFTTGIEGRLQDMESRSQQLYTLGGLAPDNFRFYNVALVAQDTWSINAHHELMLASRLDWLSVRWPEQGGREVKRLLVSPRAHWKWNHSAQWTSRFSSGLGYRAPLSFFESQHGLSEDGFTIGLTEIEKAVSLGYEAQYLNRNWEFGAGAYETVLFDVAYAEESQGPGQAAVFKNYSGSLGVLASFLSATYREDGWEIGATVEDYRLPDRFKSLLPVAVTEQRSRLMIEKNFGGLETMLTLNVVGARDLAPYRYDQHYQRWDDLLVDEANPGLGTAPQVTTRKNTKAPIYATLDLTLGYHPTPAIELSFSVLNITNFTQTGAGDSPLAWGQHGASMQHFHLDNMHVWGPLKGRVFLLGVKAAL